MRIRVCLCFAIFLMGDGDGEEKNACVLYKYFRSTRLFVIGFSLFSIHI